MLILTAILAIVFLIVIVNLVEASQRPDLVRLVNVGLFGMGLILLAVGVLFLATQSELAAQMDASGFIPLNAAAAGTTFVLMGVWGMLASLGPVRRLLSRVLPINPASPVHTLALFLAGLLLGNTLFTLGQGGLEVLEEAAVSVPISDVVLQQVGFVILAFAGVGALVRRDWTAALQRLGLVRPTARHLRTGVLWMFGMLAVQWTIGAVWMLLDPDEAALLNNVNELFLADIDSLGEWFVLALSAGVGEEILFRGALQPVFGLGVTAVLFAIVHVQYGITPVTFAVFLIGLMLGLVRRRTSTTVAILVHFGYNFVLGLLALLATFAAQFAG